jgi:hypothetical protein
MKADVPPPAAPLELDIPSWVPEPIAQYVRTEYAADIREFEPENDEIVDLLAEQNDIRAVYADIVGDDLANIAARYQPLTCDPCMRGVWWELSRRRNGTLMHPARAVPVNAKDQQDAALHRRVQRLLSLVGMPSPATTAKDQQAAAMIELFETALACRYLHCAPPTRAEAKQMRRHYLAKAVELEWDAMAIFNDRDLYSGKSVEKFWKTLSDNCETLQAAAKVYRARANVIHRARLSLPKRTRDVRAQTVVLTISNKFRELFGSPMYGLTANIASVVLKRRIDPRKVRHWCAHPAVKA